MVVVASLFAVVVVVVAFLFAVVVVVASPFAVVMVASSFAVVVLASRFAMVVVAFRFAVVVVAFRFVVVVFVVVLPSVFSFSLIWINKIMILDRNTKIIVTKFFIRIKIFLWAIFLILKK